MQDGVALEEDVTPVVNVGVWAQKFTQQEDCGAAIVLRTAAGTQLDVLDTYTDFCTTPEHAAIETIQTAVCVTAKLYYHKIVLIVSETLTLDLNSL